MSEAVGREVGTTAATRAYVEQVLPEAPEPLDDTALDGATLDEAAAGSEMI